MTLRRGRRIAILSALASVVIAVPIARHLASTTREPSARPPRPSPSSVVHFVGEAACAPCHAREAALWRGSHHRQAMQPASASAVLGDFNDVKFNHGGVESRLFIRNGKFMARTDGPDGALHDYEISYTLGVEPLQQYLVQFPGGRYQGLEIAWDSRPAVAGGERWFHLYPREKIPSGDPLHWTGAAENWNFMCADCHSTNVHKSWDGVAGAYSTSFSEVSVSCEACHGPGSAHVSWARREEGAPTDAEHRGLLLGLDERAGVSWRRDEGGRPYRSRARDSEREIEMCARCHSRRALIHEDHVHGQPLGDDYEVALLEEPLYYPDGQVRGEVYEYGSFVQSRMHAAGVTCSDCHDPHGSSLRAAGDGLCLQCHSEQAYFTARHHFHTAGTPGARCVNCHMPATTFMVVDERRDHSLRVPRPDLSVKLGVPNACNSCHSDRPAEWAARKVEQWYGHVPSGRQQFAEALAAGAQGAPGSSRMLVALIKDLNQPAIARASAVERLGRRLTGATLATMGEALRDSDALVRRAAVSALADVDARPRAALVSPLLADRVRSVRVAAAAVMAGVPATAMTAADRAALAAATAELVAVQRLNSDRPEAHLALATLAANEQHAGAAATELKLALAIDPGFVPAAVNLADLYRTLDRDADSVAILREALRHAPDSAPLLHALGLALVRQKRAHDAIEPLAAAARLDPENARYGYVHAVALHDDGRSSESLARLEEVLVRHPFDRDSLAALTAFYRESGDARSAQRYAERLEALDADP